MEKLKKICNVVIFKYIYFSILFPVVIVFFCDKSFHFIEKFFSDNSNTSVLTEISGTLIGFLLVIAIVYFALPSDGKFKKWFIKHGHQTIFIKIILLGIMFFVLTFFTSWICNALVMKYIGMYTFIAGSLEVLAAIYYLYNLIIKSRL